MVRGPRHVRILDWRGNRAAGDDLLGLCVRQIFNQAADDVGLKIAFVDEDDADLVVIGGGTLLGPRAPATAAALTGPRVPLVIFGTGFRGPSTPLPKADGDWFRALLERASLVGVRGPISQQRCAVNGVVDVDVIGDPGLAFSPRNAGRPAGGFSVGVMVRSMGKTGEPQYLDNESTFGMIAELADHFVGELAADLCFIGLAENVHDSDREGAMEVMSRMKTAPESGFEFVAGDDPVAGFSTVAQMDYVISQRLHPTVIAWLCGKPCVAFDYQFHKTADFMESIGMGDHVVRTDEYTKELYLGKYERLMARRSEAAEQARQSITRWQERQLDFARRALALIR
jgi:polysaccharide pyruvyl transferase WcaK-like protein